MFFDAITKCSQMAQALASYPAAIPRGRKWTQDVHIHILGLCAVVSAASILIRLFDSLVLSIAQNEAETGVTEFCAFGAFVFGTMIVVQRQTPKRKKKAAQPLKHHSGASPKRRTLADARFLRRAVLSPASRRLPQLDHIASTQPDPSARAFFAEQEVTAIVGSCRAGRSAQAEALFADVLAKGPRGEGVEAARALHAVLDAWCSAGGEAERASAWVGEALGGGLHVLGRTLQLLMESLAACPEGPSRAAEALAAAIAQGAAPDASCFQYLFDRCVPEDGVEAWLARLAPSRSASAAFVGLIHAQRQTPSPQQAEAWLRRAEELGIANLTPVYNAVIQACLNANNLSRATQVFDAMDQAESPCRPDGVSYSIVMGAYAQQGSEREVELLSRRLLRSGVSAEAEGYATIVRVQARIGNFAAACKWLEEAWGSGVKLDVAAYHPVVLAMTKAGKADMAERLLHQLMQQGVRPDPSTFGVVITGYAKAPDNDAQGPERVLHLMCDHGVEPTVSSLGAALHACARIGDKRRVEALFERVVARGKAVPDAVCYNALINASVKSQDIAGAERWLEAMLAARVKPNVVTYTTLLHAYARLGNIDAAERGMEMMLANHIMPNVVSYSALMQACVKAGDVERAEKWFRQMRLAGVQANAVSYSSVLDACAKTGDWKRAERWLGAMQDDGVVPTVVCFNNVINACCKGSNAIRAEAWLRKLLCEKPAIQVEIPNIRVPAEVVATRQSFTTAAQAYASSGSYEDVERIFGDMSRFGMDLDHFSLTVLLSAYARARPRQSDRAEQVFRDYLSKGSKITPPSFHVLRTCLGINRCGRLLDQLGLKMPRLR